MLQAALPAGLASAIDWSTLELRPGSFVDAALKALFDLEADGLHDALPYVPRFRFLLDDVSHATDDELRRRAITAVAKRKRWTTDLDHSHPKRPRADAAGGGQVTPR